MSRPKRNEDDEELNLIVCNLVREIRKRNDMTQKELANYLSVSTQAVKNWEQSITFPTIGNCIKILELFLEISKEGD